MSKELEAKQLSVTAGGWVYWRTENERGVSKEWGPGKKYLYGVTILSKRYLQELSERAQSQK